MFVYICVCVYIYTDTSHISTHLKETSKLHVQSREQEKNLFNQDWKLKYYTRKDSYIWVHKDPLDIKKIHIKVTWSKIILIKIGKNLKDLECLFLAGRWGQVTQCKRKCEKKPFGKQSGNFLVEVKTLDWNIRISLFLFVCYNGHTAAMSPSSTNTYTLQHREIKAQVLKDVYFKNTFFSGKGWRGEEIQWMPIKGEYQNKIVVHSPYSWIIKSSKNNKMMEEGAKEKSTQQEV